VRSAVVDFKLRIDKNARVSLQLSATVLNSALDSVGIFKKTGTLLQSCQRAGARARFLSLDWAAGLKPAQYCLTFFLFFFRRTFEICYKF
jgi:hypothetical protein